MSIDSGFSVKVQQKYCDFTGFIAKYRHKSNGLLFTEAIHYGIIEKMQKSKVDEYISCKKGFIFIK
jgi:hypothetical protein